MKRNLKVASLALALALGGSALFAQAVKVDPAIPALPEDQRRLRQPELGRLGHPEQPDDAVGRGLPEAVPERAHPDRGQGLLDRAAGADRGHRAARPDEPRDEGRRRSTSSRRSTATSRPRSGSRSTRSRSTSTRTTRSSSSRCSRSTRIFSKGRACGGKAVANWGELGLDRRLGRQADQPLRPQLRLRHLRLLQGARALQGRLQGHGQGAAGLGLGGPGRDRGPATASATAASATGPRASSRCKLAAKKGGAGFFGTDAGERLRGQVPAVALPLRLRQQGAQQAARPAGARVHQVRALARRARRWWSRTATCRSPRKVAAGGARQAEVAIGADRSGPAAPSRPSRAARASTDCPSRARPMPRSARRPRAATRPRGALVADRVARWVVTAGGLAIIVSILGILLFILVEVLAAASPSRASSAGRADRRARRRALGALLADEHRTPRRRARPPTAGSAWSRLRDGQVGRRRGDRAAPAARPGAAARRGMQVPAGQPRCSPAPRRDGRVVAGAGRASTSPSRATGGVVDARDRRRRSSSRSIPAGGRCGASPPRSTPRAAPPPRPQLADGTLAVVRRRSRGERDHRRDDASRWRATRPQLPEPLTALVLDADQQQPLRRHRAAASSSGGRSRSGQPGEIRGGRRAGASPVTALDAADRRPLAGGRPGRTARSRVWFPVRQADEHASALTRIRDFPPHRRARSALLAPSPRDKGFLASTTAAGSGSTTRPRTARCGPGDAPLAGGTGLRLHAQGRRRLPRRRAAGSPSSTIDNPHPEVSLRALFGKVWYEGYDEPELRLAVERRHRRLRAQAVADAAARRHAQGDVLLAAARHPARRARRDVHLAVHAPGLQARTSSR